MEAYAEFVDCLQPVSDSFRQKWRVRPGAEARFQQVMPRVAAASGRAARAFDASGQHVEYKPPGTWNTHRVNPALVWSTLLDDYPVVTPDLMFTVGGQAVGILESLHEEATARERGLPGLLARFVRFPVQVREAAGLPGRTFRGGLLSGLVALLQGLLVTILGGALVYPLAKWLGWQ